MAAKVLASVMLAVGFIGSAMAQQRIQLELGISDSAPQSVPTSNEAEARFMTVADTTAAAAVSFPIVNEPIVGSDDPVNGSVYKCFPHHYDPPCFKVLDTDGDKDPESVRNLAELFAANRTARTGISTRVGRYLLSASGEAPPTDACGNSHGMSGCCRIIGTNPNEGSVYIECGG